jgi:pyruvate dehydrogenase E2 component (dihydrolipoamide acetyltransferase)
MSRLTGWRRVADALWRAPNDPQIYGHLEIDAAALLRFEEQARAAGHHVTPTHIVGRALGHVLKEVPDLNVRLRGGEAVARPTIDVFFITAVHGGHDLSGVKVVAVPSKPAVAIAEELDRRASEMKAGRDADFARSKRLMDLLPMPLLRVAVRLTAFATNDLQLDLPPLGLHPSPFGSAMITSVGMFGIPQGFAPLTWMYDVPILVLVGEIGERPVAVDGRVEVRRVLPLSVSIDHRYVDGWHLSHAMRAFQGYLAAPERFEPPFS